MWYNGASKNVVADAVLSTPVRRVSLDWRLTMNTLPHATKNGNPQPYTVYALTDQLEHVTWKDVRYIGLSVNIQARFAQHLACRSDDSNEDKNEWIQGVLAQGRLPMLHKIEEQIATIEQGRAREQHWIRYAMSQGADILNRQITYTDQERTEVHARRAIRYAQIAEILAQGTYVKRGDGREGHWYPSRLLGRYCVLIEASETLTTGLKARDGSLVRIYDASDEEFEAFISPHVPILTQGYKRWEFSERWSVIEYALFWGKELELYEVPRPPKKKRSKKKE